MTARPPPWQQKISSYNALKDWQVIQCDLMARLFVNIRPFTIMKICSTAQNVDQSKLKFLLNTCKP